MTKLHRRATARRTIVRARRVSGPVRFQLRAAALRRQDDLSGLIFCGQA